jgi:hypothetical protein
MRFLDQCANVILTGSFNGPPGSTFPIEYTFDLDLRNIIGNQLYDNYEYFGICLNSTGFYNVVSGYVNVLSGGKGNLQTPGGASLKLRIQGLPIVKTTTNGTIQSVSSGTYFPMVFTQGGGQGSGFVNTAFRGTNFPNTRKNLVMFSKPKSSFVTITLSVKSVADLNGVLRANNTTQELQTLGRFAFSIFPATE